MIALPRTAQEGLWFLTGYPHRAPHLAKALDYIRGHDRVWFARGGEISDAYRASVSNRT